MLWIVFDAKTPIDLSALDGEPSRTIRGYDFTHSRRRRHRAAQARPAASVQRRQRRRGIWTVEIGDSVLEPTHALDITRNLIGPNRSSVTIPFDEPQQVHRLDDPEVGDTLFVVTGFAPARGFIERAGFHRVPRARLDPGRGDRADRRRRQRGARAGQDRGRPAHRADAVDVAADAAARQRLAAGDVRFADLGFRPRSLLCRAPVASHRRGGGGAGKQAAGAAARSGAVLSRPRHVSGSQGRARRRAGRRQAGGRGRFGRWCCAPSPK